MSGWLAFKWKARHRHETHWLERNVRGIELIFHHHPNASLFIYSNVLAPSAVELFASAGFDVQVVGYDLEALLEGTPAKPWLEKLGACGRAAAGGRLERVERLAHMLPLDAPPPPLAPHSVGSEAHTVSETPIVNGAIMVFARNYRD
jgi:hypothetical protein